MKNIIISTILTGVLSSTAYAGQVQLNVGTDYNNDGDSLTEVFDQLGFSGTLSTSFYETVAVLDTNGDPVLDTNGDPVRVLTGEVTDTNIRSTMDTLGFNDALQTAIDGITTVDYLPNSSGVSPYQYPDVPEQNNIDTLNFIGTPGNEAFNTNFPGALEGWGLTFEYEISGTLDLVNETSNFNDGSFNAFFYDIATVNAATGGSISKEDAINANKIQVLQLDVTSSFNNAGGLFINGDINYDFDGDGVDNDTGTLAQNFLIDVDTGESYYDLWKLNEAPELTWFLDTNVEPVIPDETELVATQDGSGRVYRQATLDGSVVFNVPEPTSIALMGLGLLGLGASRRKIA